MKTLYIISWVMFVLGNILVFFNLPGGSFLRTLGSLLLLIHSIIYLVRNIKSNLLLSFLYLSFTFWTIYLLFRVHFWPDDPNILGYPLLFIISSMISSIYIIMHVQNKIKIRFVHVFFVLYMSSSIAISYTHADRIFYFFHLNSASHKNSRDLDYFAWDKYSWFLYLAQNYEEAMQANENAQKAVDRCLTTPAKDDALQYSETIKTHTERIKMKNWTSFY